MKKLLKKLDWIVDYYFVCFLYKSDKFYRYNFYMTEKWGEKYK